MCVKEQNKVLLLVAGLLLYCLALVSPQSPQEELTQLSWSISEKLQDLRQQSKTLQRELKDTTELLQQSYRDYSLLDSEREALMEQLKTFSISSENMTRQYSNLYVELREMEVKLVARDKVIKWLLGLLIFRFVLMGLGYVLYAKGVKLPRWVDILL